MDERSQHEKLPRGLLGGGVGAVLLAAIAVLLLGVTRNRAQAQDAAQRRDTVAAGPVVRVVKVAVSPAERVVTLPAEARAFQRATLYAKVSGYLKTIGVDKGDRVRKGQVLATLEAPDAEEQVRSAAADLQLKHQLLQRTRSLAPSGYISRVEVDRAEAEAKVAEATLARARAQLGYLTLRAPFDGVVTARYADPGALLPAATGATQSALPLLEVADPDRLRVSVQLGQDDAALVRVGDPVTLQLVASGDPVSARVTRLAQSLDARTRTMLAEIDLLKVPEGLYPGAFVEVALTLRGAARPLVPVEALMTRNGEMSVPTIADKRVHFVRVRTGIDDGKTVEILSGLHGGELVALNLGTDAAEGSAVQPAEATKGKVAQGR